MAVSWDNLTLGYCPLDITVFSNIPDNLFIPLIQDLMTRRWAIFRKKPVHQVYPKSCEIQSKIGFPTHENQLQHASTDTIFRRRVVEAVDRVLRFIELATEITHRVCDVVHDL